MGGQRVVVDLAPPDLITRLAGAAEHFAARLAAVPGARMLPTADWLARARQAGSLRRPVVWRNWVFRTPTLRRAHVEFFALEGEIGILHLCAFPRLDHALPILGFDVITGRQKPTGCFLDLSPSVPAAAPMIAAWAAAAAMRQDLPGEPRILPDWAAVFSPHAVAVRPRSAADIEAGLALGEATLEWLLAAPAPARVARDSMRAAQLRYGAAQRQNDRTRRMLAGCVGAEIAEAFIARCLFPPPRGGPGRMDRPRATERSPASTSAAAAPG